MITFCFVVSVCSWVILLYRILFHPTEFYGGRGSAEDHEIYQPQVRINDWLFSVFFTFLRLQLLTSVVLFPLHRCASASDQLQLFAKEQERNKLLSSSASHKSDTKTSSTPSKSRKTPKAQKGKKAGGSRNKGQEEHQQVRVDHTEDEELDGKSDEADEKSGAKRTEEEECVTRKQTEPDAPVTQSAQAESENLIDHNFWHLMNYQLGGVFKMFISVFFCFFTFLSFLRWEPVLQRIQQRYNTRLRIHSCSR